MTCGGEVEVPHDWDDIGEEAGIWTVRGTPGMGHADPQLESVPRLVEALTEV
jgi:hypothetical protein